LALTLTLTPTLTFMLTLIEAALSSLALVIAHLIQFISSHLVTSDQMTSHDVKIS
jgi:hypothetical protein